MTKILLDGGVVGLDDEVWFNVDFQQVGRITDIDVAKDRCKLELTNEDGFIGGTFGGRTIISIDADDCWVGE